MTEIAAPEPDQRAGRSALLRRRRRWPAVAVAALPQTTGVLNDVLLGSGTRDPHSKEGRSEEGRSGSILVGHLEQQRDRADITSFPRGRYVHIPGYGKNTTKNDTMAEYVEKYPQG